MHGQITNVWQYHPPFSAAYSGPNSLKPGSQTEETFDATLYLGARLWPGAEAWVNPEIDEGFGLSDTLGAAGYPNGEAYKVGRAKPYFRLQRAFIRQTFNLGGASQQLQPDANVLGGTGTENNLVLTAGKLSPVDIFDTNAYAHDPKGDFLNWSVIDAGAYDYAADAWGYSYGVAAEWTQSWWTARTGVFDLSKVPNSTLLETTFSQYEFVAELEGRYSLWSRSGRIKLLGFVNRGRMGRYDDAVRLGEATNTLPDTALVRRFASKPGAAINIEQSIDADLGAFLRASASDGNEEAFEFTEINKSISLGLSCQGGKWGRTEDSAGAAFVANAMSKPARAYFDAGGLGILIGDGALPHYHTEDIFEIFYDTRFAAWIKAGLDYQYIANPAYNHDRGPVSVLAARLHVEF